MNTKEVLIKARELISDPARWTQRAYARRRNDRAAEALYSNNHEAQCFCSLGAIGNVLGVKFPESVGPECMPHPAVDVLRRAIEVAYHKNLDVASFNDLHTHEEVLAAFDKAIEIAPEQS